MLFLALAVGCSLAIGMIFKWAARQRLDRLTLVTANYLAATGLGAALTASDGGLGTPPSLALVLLGVGVGILFIGGFFALGLATEIAGMSLAIGVMRVSVVVPFLASWLVWDEVPTPLQGLGLAVASVAFFLIARGSPTPEAPDASPARVAAVLAVLFVLGGAVDTSLKVFDEAFGDEAGSALFLLLVFAAAFGVGAALTAVRLRRTPTKLQPRTVGWGLALGVVNYYSAEFLLRAVRLLPGTFVFPVNNVAVVLGAALLGVLVWGERLTPRNWLGIGGAALALALLSG